ncbi:IPT/TIG domain-containing protein [Actinoplanes sp. NPDC049802]|uniref:IPT/TIG domain-containing protein n=1 Tax=Actinoplanes sp. NPDC049802 TaxID=3154742 RepID=UPI0033F1D3F5
MTAGVLTVDPLDVKRISGTKIAFKVPSRSYPGSGLNATGLVLTGSQTTARWNVCVYDSDAPVGSTLLATSSYTVVLRPTITSVTPTSSPAGGGQAITVNGTGFTAVGSTSVTAAIGGTPLTNIRVAANGNSLTATTGPRTADTGLALTVTTPGGTVSSLDPDNDSNTADSPIPFNYSNGITIVPNTAAAGSSVTVDVTGAGFGQLTFVGGDSPTSSNAQVFLVSGAYNAAGNRGVAECDDVAVISDVELVCTLNLAADRLNPATSAPVPSTPVSDGAYTLTVVANGSTGAGPAANPTIVSSGSTFTVGPY